MEYKKKLEESTTLYVGNLNWFSTETDVRQLFSRAGHIKSIIMGVEKKTLASGEFCFVEYVRVVYYFQNVCVLRKKYVK